MGESKKGVGPARGVAQKVNRTTKEIKDVVKKVKNNEAARSPVFLTTCKITLLVRIKYRGDEKTEGAYWNRMPISTSPKAVPILSLRSTPKIKTLTVLLCPASCGCAHDNLTVWWASDCI